MQDKEEKRKAYRKEWMRAWRKNNKDKARETQQRYWKKRIDKVEAEKEETNDSSFLDEGEYGDEGEN